MEMTITATEFKVRCSELMDRVNQTGESIVMKAPVKRPSFLGCMEGELDELVNLPPEYSVFNLK